MRWEDKRKSTRIKDQRGATTLGSISRMKRNMVASEVGIAIADLPIAARETIYRQIESPRTYRQNRLKRASQRSQRFWQKGRDGVFPK